jgi:hypothetical protein
MRSNFLRKRAERIEGDLVFVERIERKFLGKDGSEITILLWGRGTTKQNARRRAERAFSRIVRDQSGTFLP